MSTTVLLYLYPVLPREQKVPRKGVKSPSVKTSYRTVIFVPDQVGFQGYNYEENRTLALGPRVLLSVENRTVGLSGAGSLTYYPGKLRQLVLYRSVE